MALTTLTGQNIQDTYQKVVQTDGTNLADGTGSLLPISIDGNNVTISGSLTANEYIVSSSVTNITVATLSGSTAFGDSIDDTHTFIGHITSSGDISSSGTITAGNIELHPGGAIRPTANNNTITFRSTDHGSGEYMVIGSDTFEVHMNGGAADIIQTPTGLSMNAASADQDVRINYQNGDAAFISDAASHFTRMAGPVVISRSGSGATTPLGTNFGAVTDGNSALQLSGSLYIHGPTSHITASGDISSSGNLIVSQSILFGSADSIIGMEGGNEYIRFLDNQTSICMDSVEVFTINHTGPGDGQIGINASNQDIDVKITFDDGTNAFHSDVGNNRVYLRDYIHIGEGSTATSFDALTVSGSINVIGLKTHITASANISASGNIYAAEFIGDGAQITGVTAEWDGTHVGDAQITGSLILSGSGDTKLTVEGNITASGNISASGARIEQQITKATTR